VEEVGAMKCVNCGNDLPEEDDIKYDVPADVIWDKPQRSLILTPLQLDFRTPCDTCKKNNEAASKLRERIRFYEKKPAFEYLSKELKGIQGEEK